MLEKMIKSYYDLFDKKIKHGTSVIFIISIIIIFVGIMFSGKDVLLYSRNSILQSNDTYQNTVIIGGVKYKISLEKLD